jgi:hypothetical protein
MIERLGATELLDRGRALLRVGQAHALDGEIARRRLARCQIIGTRRASRD